MNDLKMSIKKMISDLDIASGMLIFHGMGNPTINEAREIIMRVSSSLAEYEDEISEYA